MSGIHVLLVDDEPAIVRALQFGLKRRGFEVLSQANGRDALTVLKSPRKLDLLLSDVIMPGGISGIELARASRAIRPELPVLLTTGYAYDLLEGTSKNSLPRHDRNEIQVGGKQSRSVTRGTDGFFRSELSL
jgi:CheY-like chemotaxis protein